jgi:uncharacterized protein (TIGR01777 family)
MANQDSRVLIAGGTGLIGKKLQQTLQSAGYQVSILTRNKQLCNNSGYLLWNPDANFIQENALRDVDVIVNLCGSGIADKRWTPKRKIELHDSRVKPTLLLLQEARKCGNIKHYVSASGINCYPVNTEHVVTEKDSYGTDYLSKLVQAWEAAALKFEELCPVTLLRISAVLSKNGGFLAKMKPLFKWGLGVPLGSGKQPFTWVHEDDLVTAILHLVNERLPGAYNICGETVSNRHFSHVLAKSLHRKMLPVSVPGFVLRAILGEMSEMLLNGVNTNADRLEKSGFVFRFKHIEQALALESQL